MCGTRSFDPSFKFFYSSKKLVFSLFLVVLMVSAAAFVNHLKGRFFGVASSVHSPPVTYFDMAGVRRGSARVKFF